MPSRVSWNPSSGGSLSGLSLSGSGDGFTVLGMRRWEDGFGERFGWFFFW